jgi:hypothetical protein
MKYTKVLWLRLIKQYEAEKEKQSGALVKK